MRTNIYIKEVPEEKEKEKGTERLFEKMLIRHLENLRKDESRNPRNSMNCKQNKSRESHTKTYYNETVKSPKQRKS